VKKVAGKVEFQDGRQNGRRALSASLYQDSYLSWENKLVVFSRVLGSRHFNQTIHFARKTMEHC